MDSKGNTEDVVLDRLPIAFCQVGHGSAMPLQNVSHPSGELREPMSLQVANLGFLLLNRGLVLLQIGLQRLKLLLLLYRKLTKLLLEQIQLLSQRANLLVFFNN